MNRQIESSNLSAASEHSIQMQNWTFKEYHQEKDSMNLNGATRDLKVQKDASPSSACQQVHPKESNGICQKVSKMKASKLLEFGMEQKLKSKIY